MSTSQVPRRRRERGGGGGGGEGGVAPNPLFCERCSLAIGPLTPSDVPCFWELPKKNKDKLTSRKNAVTTDPCHSATPGAGPHVKHDEHGAFSAVSVNESKLHKTLMFTHQAELGSSLHQRIPEGQEGEGVCGPPDAGGPEGPESVPASRRHAPWLAALAEVVATFAPIGNRLNPNVYYRLPLVALDLLQLIKLGSDVIDGKLQEVPESSQVLRCGSGHGTGVLKRQCSQSLAGFNQPGLRLRAGGPTGGTVVLPVTEQALCAHRTDGPILRGCAGFRVATEGTTELQTLVLHGGKALQLHICLHCSEERGVLRYSSALDTSTALSQVWTEVWLPKDASLLPAADSMAMVTALVLSRLSVEL
ncbi:hypothetical protein INR49_028636 [Caranx melampygus]|nr:hypothetical protein INR49_028636 [Caranx melampygus]